MYCCVRGSMRVSAFLWKAPVAGFSPKISNTSARLYANYSFIDCRLCIISLNIRGSRGPLRDGTTLHFLQSVMCTLRIPFSNTQDLLQIVLSYLSVVQVLVCINRPLSFSILAKSGLEYTLFCTYGGRLNSTMTFPPDGMCDYIFFDSLHSGGRNILGTTFEPAVTNFFTVAATWNKTKFGVSVSSE